MMNVAVLYGGRSGEHDVSCCSAASVVRSLDKAKYAVTAIGISKDGRWYLQEEPSFSQHHAFGKVLALHQTGDWTVNCHEAGGKLVLSEQTTNRVCECDVVFPALHGTNCEDGTLQGLLSLARVPYVGCGTLSSAVCMDKEAAKLLMQQAGVPVVPWKTVSYLEWQRNAAAVAESIVKLIGLPFFVKPAAAGSSVGVVKIKTADEIVRAFETAFKYDNKVLAEKAIDAREIECGVLGNEEPMASPLGEIVPNADFYSYEAKYIDEDGAALIIPAKLSDKTSDEIRAAAVRVFKCLYCTGLARVDFFIDKSTGEYYCNEVNTMPGFTSISMYPKLWEAAGVPYPELLDRLIELALARHKAESRISTEFIYG